MGFQTRTEQAQAQAGFIIPFIIIDLSPESSSSLIQRCLWNIASSLLLYPGRHRAPMCTDSLPSNEGTGLQRQIHTLDISIQLLSLLEPSLQRHPLFSLFVTQFQFWALILLKIHHLLHYTNLHTAPWGILLFSSTTRKPTTDFPKKPDADKTQTFLNTKTIKVCLRLFPSSSL